MDMISVVHKYRTENSVAWIPLVMMFSWMALASYHVWDLRQLKKEENSHE
jgi:hypothetical protein